MTPADRILKAVQERAKRAACAAIDASPHLFEQEPHHAEIAINFGRDRDEAYVKVQTKRVKV